MVHHTETHITEEFKRIFSELHNDLIQQLVHESRLEAFAQAKEILKNRALNSFLSEVMGDESEQYQSLERKKTPSINKEVRADRPTDKQSSDTIPHKPALSDRILEEIEAIREQILRNEELLSQIKPLIGLPKTTSEQS
ncbi:MAG: hypothetical protein KTR29_19565 [Rhodothermaceae bacterium]|nr:hypothetical protein [Rhodothermaceae bacterium]